MVILLRSNNPSGKRFAVSHDGTPADAPLLHVDFTNNCSKLADHAAGQESDAFTESGGETDTELFGFKLDPDGSATQIVFSLSAISGLVDGDWAGIEIVVDASSGIRASVK